jgi:hypothetical protein
MKMLKRVGTPCGLILAASMLFLSGCVVHEREHDVVHDGGGSYAQGYKEGYYDREHNRYWSEQAWHDCIEHDVHCPH